MNRILILILTLVCSGMLKMNAQTIESLIGKDIIIPGRNPSELIYKRSALAKLSFKKKDRSDKVITNQPIHLSKAYMVNENKSSEAYIVEIETATDSLLLRFPTRLTVKEREKIYSDRSYFPAYSETVLFFGNDVLRTTPDKFRLPHYLCSDIAYIEKELIGKAFYSVSKPYYTPCTFRTLKKDNEGYYFIYRHIWDANDSLKVSLFDRDDKIAHRKYSFHLEYFYPSEFEKEYLSVDSLIEKGKSRPTYQFYEKIREAYTGRRVHIKSLNMWRSDFFRLSDKKEISILSEGYYTIKDFRQICYQPDSQHKPYYYPYVIIANEEGVEYAANLSEKNFKAAVMDAQEYDRRENLRIEKAMKAEEKRQKEEAEEERKEYNRLIRLYGAANAKLIRDNRIKLGFTKSMVEESWGYPYDTTTITNAMGTIECWIYGMGSYVYFTHGKVVQIIN